jgi:pimeloyl-ACP methyl ester carboxylesterase
MVPVIEMARAGTYVDRWLAPWLADKQLARSANGIGGMTYSDPRNPTDEAIETYFAPLVTPRGRVQVNAYAIALERDPLIGIEPALQRCGVPVRIVWGTGDTIFSSASPDYLDNCAFAQSRGVRRVAGAKLFFPEEYPDVIAEEARRLWGIG